MPQITHEKIIREYYETVKDKYNIDFKIFEEICKAPFAFIKHLMKQKELYIISIKYMGKFRVFQSKLKKEISNLDIKLEKGYITLDEYEATKQQRLQELKIITNDI